MARRNVTEQPVGTKDGVNQLFDTSATYVPTTILYYLNGQLQPQENVVELGGTRFQVWQAPEADDDFYVRYTAVV